MAALDPSLDLTTLDSSCADVSIQTIEGTDEGPPDAPGARGVSPAWGAPDPDLCLTPEKTAKTAFVKRHVPARHVHFDVPSSSSDSSIENKENYVDVQHFDSKDEENTGGDDIRQYSYDVKNVEPEYQYDVRKHGPKIENHSSRAVFKEVVHLPENRELRAETARSLNMQGVVVEEEHIFKKPELHSTLKVGLELKKVQEESKLKPRLETKLQCTSVQQEKLRKQEEALSEGRDVFCGPLTGLDVSESLVSAVESQLQTRRPPPDPARRQKSYAAPELMSCWADWLEKEVYVSTPPILATPTPPINAPPTPPINAPPTSAATPTLQLAQHYSVYNHLLTANIL